MNKEKRNFNFTKSDLIYHPAIYYAPILTLILLDLRRSSKSSSSILLFLLLFLLPLLGITLVETYLVRKNSEMKVENH